MSTDPAVELVAREVWPASMNGRTPHDAPENAVRSLIAACRLLPPVVQTREEKGWWKTGEVQTWWSFTSDGSWREPDRVRTISTLAEQEGHPYSGATITHPWRVYNPEAGQ